MRPVKEFRVRVPAALQERRDHRRANPPPGRDQRRVARRAAKQGARGIPADRDVGAAPERADEPRRAGGHPGAGSGARGRLHRHHRPAAACRSADQSAGGVAQQDRRARAARSGRAGRTPPTVLVYRYLRPGYKLALEARRYDEAEVLQGLIDNARLATVVADDGQMMTEVYPEHPQQWPAAPGNRAAGEDHGLVGVRGRRAGPPQPARGQAAAAARTRHRLRRAGRRRADLRRAGQVPEDAAARCRWSRRSSTCR